MKINWSFFGRLFTNEIGLILLSLFITIPASSINSTLFVLASALSLGFYLYLNYGGAWDYGFKARKHGSSGDVAAIILAFALNLIVTVVYYVSLFADAGNVFFVANAILRILQAPFLGFVQVFFKDFTWIFAIILFVVPLITYAGYALGRKDFKVTSLLGIKPAAVNKDDHNA